MNDHFSLSPYPNTVHCNETRRLLLENVFIPVLITENKAAEHLSRCLFSPRSKTQSIFCVEQREWAGLPWWLSSKESTCNTRDTGVRGGLDPWVGATLWRRAWQPTPVFLPGESHGWGSLQATSHRVAKSWDTTGATEHAHTEGVSMRQETVRPCPGEMH